MGMFSRLSLATAAAGTLLLAGCASSGDMSAEQKTKLLNQQRDRAADAAQVLATADADLHDRVVADRAANRDKVAAQDASVQASLKS